MTTHTFFCEVLFQYITYLQAANTARKRSFLPQIPNKHKATRRANVLTECKTVTSNLNVKGYSILNTGACEFYLIRAAPDKLNVPVHIICMRTQFTSLHLFGIFLNFHIFLKRSAKSIFTLDLTISPCTQY